ncbi:MAG: PAS domain S-box protein [Rhizobiales bacterium]|nr:PAS domain S-box protein [Hyphomicrobiales bacterium]OJY46456.1 MAG: PAS sensor domain-containing protein [Rhizobiales bacterium 64-17]
MDLTSSIASAVLASEADAIVAGDPEGLIRFWNPGAERIFGYTATEASGQSLDLIIPERLRKAHWDGWHKVMQTGRSRYAGSDLLSVPAIRKDGERISVAFTIAPVSVGGKIALLVAVMRDVTREFNEMKALRLKVSQMAGTS